MTQDMRQPKNARISYDPRISLNTIIICITAIAGAWGLVDRISANAAQVTTMEASIKTTRTEITRLETQRQLDRQELLTELRDIKAEISKLRR